MAAFARDLDTPMTVYRADGWVVAATPHGPSMLLAAPPSRITGAYPFAVVARRGASREFAFVERPKDKGLSVHAEWTPHLRPIDVERAHPDTVELTQWLAGPRAWETRARATGRLEPLPEPDLPAGMTVEQHVTIERWLADLSELTAAVSEYGSRRRIDQALNRGDLQGPDPLAPPHQHRPVADGGVAHGHPPADGGRLAPRAHRPSRTLA